MKVTLPTLLAALACLGSIATAAARSAQDAQNAAKQARELLRAAQGELARQGLELGADPVLEGVKSEAWLAAIDADLQQRTRAGVFEARRLLRDALAQKVPASADEFRAARAAAIAESALVRFDAPSGRLLFNQERPFEPARFERELLEQLVLLARERRHPRAAAADAAQRPTSESQAVSAAVRAGEALVRVAAVMEARGGRAARDEAGVVDPAERLAREAGSAFMTQRQLLGGLGALDGAFDELPASSEQLLHAPKLYRDRPREVVLPQLSAEIAPARVVCDDQLGELGVLEVLLEAGVEPDRARLAASGWDGDRMYVYEDANGAVAQVWRLYFDRPDDVRQFVELWRAKASGRIIARALTCDWIRASSVALATKLEQELAAAPPKLQPSPEDQGSTTEVEAQLASVLSRAPSLEGSLWRVPQFDFSMRVPESWKLEVFEGVPYVFAEQIERYRDNISVAEVDVSIDESADQLLERQTRVITKQPNLKLIKAEKRIVDGRQGVYLRYSGESGAQELEFAALMFVRNQRLVAVTTSASRATWPTLESLIDAAYRTIEVRPSGAAAK